MGDLHTSTKYYRNCSGKINLCHSTTLLVKGYKRLSYFTHSGSRGLQYTNVTISYYIDAHNKTIANSYYNLNHNCIISHYCRLTIAGDTGDEFRSICILAHRAQIGTR